MYRSFLKLLFIIQCFAFRHDKWSLWSSASVDLLPRIVRAPFFASPTLRDLLDRCEDVYSLHLCGGDHGQAMDELRVQREPLSPLVLVSLGTAFGISVLLLVAFILILTLNTEVTSQWKFYAAFPIYRGYALLILCVWLWGANVFVFHRTRVNHVFVLEADSRTSLTHVQIWQYAAIFTVLYMLSLVSYLLIGTLLPCFLSHFESAIGIPHWNSNCKICTHQAYVVSRLCFCASLVWRRVGFPRVPH